MLEYERERAERQAKQLGVLGPLVAQMARRANADELAVIMEDMRATDALGDRGHALIQLPAGSYDYWDIGFIFHVISGVYYEKIGTSTWILPDAAAVLAAVPTPAGMSMSVPGYRVVLGEAPTTDARRALETPIHVPILDAFGALCSPRTREDVVDLAMADIRRLVRAQRAQGRDPRFIEFLAWWHAVRCTLTVVWDFSLRAVGRLQPLLRLLIEWRRRV